MANAKEVKKVGHPKEDYQVDKSTDAYKKAAGQLKDKKEDKKQFFIVCQATRKGLTATL